MWCITFDIDGNVVSKEQKPKRWRPRNGFQRGDDGNFYKQLGDPRNISDIEAAEAIKAREEEERKQREKEAQSKKVEQVIEDQVQRVRDLRYKSTEKPIGTQVCRCDPQWRVTPEELHESVFWRGMSRSPNNKFIAYRECNIWVKWGVPHLDAVEKFQRIEVHINKNQVKFWTRHYVPGDETPDFVLVDGLK